MYIQDRLIILLLGADSRPTKLMQLKLHMMMELLGENYEEHYCN